MLQRARVDRLVGERRAVLARPGDPRFIPQLQQQFELFGEELVVVVQVVAEERERLDEGAAPGHDLGAAVGDQIEGAEILADAHRVVGTEHGDGAGEANPLRARRGSGQHDRRRGNGIVGAVMLADAVDIEPDLIGQLDLFISLLYVVFLGTVGGLMLLESVNAMRRAAKNVPPTPRKPGHHHWVHRLPFKVRFKKSKIYLSVIPVIALGFAIGILTSVMGVGGGFIMVPAMIYLLRIPTNVVVGTSLFQIIFVTAYTTIVQAATNFSVDIVLAFILMVAGVIGAQYGVRVGQKLRGEQLRALLGLLVLAVGIRLAISLVVTPADIYSIVMGGN